jgi:two-component system sensor histidine kinase UhpB
MSGLLAESQEKNRRLDEQLEAVQEEERASLARDLHDDVGPLLFSVDVDATTIRDIADKRGDAVVSERAASIQEAVAQVKEQVRSILWQLRPGVVLDLGLANAIENMLAPLRQRHTDVTFRLDMPKRSWRPQIDIALLAIVREAVLNALKHGKPTRIDIRIASDDGRTVEALIRNNGSSLGMESATGRLGVISMQERTHLLGGRLDVTNASDGHGVEVRVAIPLDGPGSGPAPTVPSTKTLQ